MTITEDDINVYIEDCVIPKGREKADITDKPQSKRQEKFAEMIIMNADTPDFYHYFGKVKMLVGVTKQKKDAKKIQYSITAIETLLSETLFTFFHTLS